MTAGPIARPIQPPIKAPATPSNIVMMNPPGSRPGINSFASAPASPPMTIQAMIP